MIICNHLLLGGGKINNLKKVGKNFLSQLLCIATILGTTSCNNDQVFNQTDNAPLQVSVNAQGTQSSRAIIHGEYLPDGSSIGISLFTPDGADYDNQGYFNVKYTASGEGESQSWAAQGTTPSISANPANLVAYYPWSDDENLDLTAIPVENASQTDYMYAGLVEGITNANPKVNITMQHALTAIRVNLVLGNYTGDAAVSGIAIKSSALGSAATMDITNNGALNGISGQGDEFALTTEFDLSAAGTTTDVLFVPDASVTEGSTTVSATIGGKKYTAAISFDEAYLQGYIYTYTLTLNNSGFQLTKVNVTPWQTGTDGSATLEPEIDNAYIVKIVASYSAPMPTSLLSLNTSSRASETFYFQHNVKGFVGTVDWGDGTIDTYDELTYNSIDHAYPNDSKEYIITVKGNIEGLEAFGESFQQCLKEIVHIGDCGITSMDGAFRNCSNLVTIPEGLFDKCTEITILEWTFSNCKNLQSIPKGLFDKCTEVTSFYWTFANCISLQTIPEGLFDYNTKVTSFRGVFGCSGITSIPEGLFDHCTEVTSFEDAFYCTNITTVPTGLFDNNRKVTAWHEVFKGCTNLTGESPYTTIQVDGVDTKVHLYERELYPEYFTAPTNYSNCFYRCTGLTDYSSIPSGWK